ncbi:MAG: TonB-dependent receptor plug domain-containing protein, partial [Niabella sp.]
MKKKTISVKCKMILACFLCCQVLYLHASGNPGKLYQDRIVKGTVTEKETGTPLAGVSVSVKGGDVGTVTNSTGQYEIRVVSDDAVLVFTHAGKIQEERAVAGLSVIDVAMENDVALMEEVYVGYMVQRKKDLTGAISLATGSDIAKNPSANAMKSLQGKLAGVHITTNGGNPAEGVNVQIRGLSSLSGSVRPLIVLDGMPTENLNLRDINAADIESIQVLKDAASASIYGARASGGVILIQTRKAKMGEAKVEYSGSYAISKVVQRPTLMNAEQYGEAMFRAYAYDEQVYNTPMTLPATYDFTWHRDADGRAVLDAVKPAEFLNADKTVRGSNTNWLDEILQPAALTEHQVTVSKGTDRSKSLFSLGYFNNQGTQIHTFFRKYSIRTNTEYSLLNNRLKVGENLAISYLQYRD